MASEINFENLPSVLQRVLRLLGTPLEQKTRGDTIFPYINELAQEFKALGAEDVEVNPYGVLFASLPQKGPRNAPKLGFLASYGRLTHEVPNAPDWKLLRYHGENIAIDPLQDVVLSNKRLPELSRFLGEELLVSAGARPLNLTTRVGIAMMLGILEHFQKHPDLEHAALRFAVVPETLIAGGEKYFDLERFGADYAYELVAPGLGTLVTECFNAARAVVTLRGKDVFPGYGKDRLVSAIRLMHDFIDDLPRDELPERTEGHEGYYHPVHVEGGVGLVKALVLIRDFGFDSFEVRKSRLQAMCQDFDRFGPDTCTVTIMDEYENMGRILSRTSRVVKQFMLACRSHGVSPEATSIRGTTDGARLTSRGLPCPAFFIGTEFIEEGPLYETLPISSLEKAQAVAIELAVHSAHLRSLA